MNLSSFNSWITCPRPNPKSRLRLFCFPYAGGGTLIFREWPDFLPFDVEVCPILLPGREKRISEQPYTNLSPLIQTLANIIRHYVDLPFVFFGHSMGALIGFELARQLRRQKAPGPLHLIVSGRRASQIPDPDPPIHQLPDAEFKEELRRFNGTPEAVLRDPELMELFLPLLRADVAVNETYVYTHDAPLDCPISAFGGLNDSEVSREELDGWRDQTTNTFALSMFPGDHFFIKSERHAFLHKISQDLSQV